MLSRDEGPKERLFINIFVALLFAWFAAAIIFKAVHQPLSYDDSYNATVASNFAAGYGWVTDYNQLIPFNSTVTTGPALLLPAAAMVKVFGLQLWVPSVTNALLMLVVLVFCGALLREFSHSSKSFLCAAALSLLCLAVYDLNIWTQLVGDGFSAIALVAAIFFLARSSAKGPSPFSLLAAGFFFAAAILSKMYAVIAVLGVAFAVCAQEAIDYARGGRTAIRTSKSIGVVLIGGLLLLAPWQLYKMGVLGGLPESLQVKRAIFSEMFFREFGSGIEELEQADALLAHFLAMSRKNFSGLLSYLQLSEWWGGGFALMMVTLPFLVGGCLLFWRPRNAALRAELFLAAGASAHWFWYIFISAGGPRYVRISIVLSCILFACLLARRLNMFFLAALLGIGMTLLPPSKQDNLVSLLRFNNDSAQTLSAQARFAQAAITTAGVDEPLAGCSWVVSRLVDYAAPANGGLVDVVLLMRKALEQQNYSAQLAAMPAEAQAGLPIVLQHPIKVRLPMHLGEWAYAKRLMLCPIADYLESVCRQSVFEDGYYVIRTCTISSLPADVASTVLATEPLHLSGSL
ncbi:hypothetical protein [Aquipseudomonas alcaligenes]|uniref:hypothetical protein n=1 Tax=Aquipseudomonas alcaligenes TaxID=43263 RepID=UPI003666B8B2